jgi:cytoskeletal protein RodZ
MDKKSFFRGFGVGVLFAAVILGVSFTVRTSDSYVAQRAKKLGMVYQETDSVLALATAAPEASEEAKATAAASEKPDSSKKSSTKKKESTPAPSAKESPSVTPEVTAQAATASPKSSSKTASNIENSEKKMEAEKKKMQESIKNEEKSLVISVGDWSSDVSEKLEALGVIDSAKNFDKFLNDNGYSSSIHAGTYKVSLDDTYSDLAKKITGK